ncbi:hypothetical protein NC99_18370 [Sunxiuqinia dokdonensis]|uniref:Uncharacterized protein n=1 Tax=Sunxiuqinia dokdonensis TaxID=1409788 RepID=A0A0L8VA57_9BACT|nr:hypothetical protein NC99_18370 [Sunxiuqinia dokdonensis]
MILNNNLQRNKKHRYNEKHTYASNLTFNDNIIKFCWFNIKQPKSIF